MDSYFPQQNFGRRLDPPRYDLLFVKGRQGAMSFEMGPNSRVLLPDADEPGVWYVCTDELGRKSTCIDYDMVQRRHEPEPTPQELKDTIAKLTDKITNLEVQLGVESADAKQS